MTTLEYKAQTQLWVEERDGKVYITEAQELAPGTTRWRLLADEEIPGHPLITWLCLEQDLSLPTEVIKSIQDLVNCCQGVDGWGAYGGKGTLHLRHYEDGSNHFLLDYTWQVQVPEPIRKNVPAIRSMEDLCDFFNADEPCLLNKRIYNATECGASISVYLPDGTAIHNDDGMALSVPGPEVIDFGDMKVRQNITPPITGWRALTRDTPISGFTIQTIVEGSDSYVNGGFMEIPITKAEVQSWIDSMEQQADALWKRDNYSHYYVQDRKTGVWIGEIHWGADDPVEIEDDESGHKARLTAWLEEFDGDELPSFVELDTFLYELKSYTPEV